MKLDEEVAHYLAGLREAKQKGDIDHKSASMAATSPHNLGLRSSPSPPAVESVRQGNDITESVTSLPTGSTISIRQKGSPPFALGAIKPMIVSVYDYGRLDTSTNDISPSWARVPEYGTSSPAPITPPQTTRATLPHLVHPPLPPLLLQADDIRALMESPADLESHREGQAGQSDVHGNGDDGCNTNSWVTEDSVAGASEDK